MSNDFSATRREREWLRQTEGWIRRGDTAQMLGLLTEASTDPHLRPKFTASALASIIHAPHNKPAAKKRLELLRAYLEHPHAPLPDPDLRPGLITVCLDKGLHGLLPLLHAAGFHARPTTQDYQHAARAMTEGKWPHADLMLPKILHDEDVAWKIAAALFNTRVMKVEYIDKLCTLDASPRFIKAASRRLVRCLDDAPHALEDLPEAGTIVGRLLARGFLDPAQIHKEAAEHDDAIQQRVAKIVASGQAWQLQRTTPTSTGSQRRRL